MKKIGVTGATGFLGAHLVARLQQEKIPAVLIGREDFADEPCLAEKIGRCSDVVHFAGLSRHADGEYLYRINLELGEKLVRAAQKKAGRSPRLILASTTHIDRETPYHRSKRDVAALFAHSGKNSVELLMPNVFGAGEKPFYNSVVATFCRQCADGVTPEKIDDVELRLIYVETLMDEIVRLLRDDAASGRITLADEYRIPLPDVWAQLCRFRKGAVPTDDFGRDLAAMFAAYREIRN